MSIIVTHISQYGIIHAADSNLTNDLGAPAGQSSKLFPIKRLDAALTVAGNYSVGGESMDLWMSNFISRNNFSNLRSFVETLASALNREAAQDEKRVGYFLHIAGYVSISSSPHPEFYHITNFKIDQKTGDYSVPNLTLGYSEDFWRKYSAVPENQLFGNGKGYIYCNGFVSGRIAYFKLLKEMERFRSEVWLNPNWQFRPPVNVNEEAKYLKHDMELISLFFKHSKYSAPFIGGGIDFYTIKSP
jgi:hypothetical protein